MQAEVAAFLAGATGGPVAIERLERMAGGASHEAWALDALAGQQRLALVMRRSMGGALTTLALDREAEFAVLKAAHESGVAAPRPYWLANDIGGKPAFFMERIEGETVGRKIVSDPRVHASAATLCADLARCLAAIHMVDVTAHGLEDVLARPRGASTPAQSELDRLTQELDDLGEAHPALELGLRWLRRREPPPGPASFVHGDYRIGNVVIGPAGVRAVLDWEFAHIGDPAEDVGWLCVRAWRFGSDRKRVGGIADLEPFLAAYTAAGGAAIDPATAFYWEVMGNVKWALGALFQARRHLGGEERSIELASLGRIAAEMEYELLHLIEAAG